MKPKKIKARKMWGGLRPFLLLPADDASLEAMVEQMAQSISGSAVPWDHIGHGAQQVRINMIRAALAAIGIKSGK